MKHKKTGKKVPKSYSDSLKKIVKKPASAYKVKVPKKKAKKRAK